MAKRGCDAPQEIVRQGYLAKRSQNIKRFTPVSYNLRWFCLTKNNLSYFNSDGEITGRKDCVLAAADGGYNGVRNLLENKADAELTGGSRCKTEGTSDKKQREKGRIPLNSVKWIEKADLGGEPPPNEIRSRPLGCLNFYSHSNRKPNAGLQVGYSVESKTRVLYVQAIDETDRDLWLESIRHCLNGKVGSNNTLGPAGSGGLVTSPSNGNSVGGTATPCQFQFQYHRGVWSVSAQKWTCCASSDRDSTGCEPVSSPNTSTSTFVSSSSASSTSSSSPPSSLTSNVNNSIGPHSLLNSANSNSKGLLTSSPTPTGNNSLAITSGTAAIVPTNLLLQLNGARSPAKSPPPHLSATPVYPPPKILIQNNNCVPVHGGIQNNSSTLISTLNTTRENGIGIPTVALGFGNINNCSTLFVSPEKLNILPISNHSNDTLIADGFMSSPEMAGGNPGTPLNKPRDKSSSRRVVVALYPFKAIEAGDLSLEKGEEYEIVDDSQEHWWQVRDKNGAVGYIPSNYVKEKELLGLQKYDWYVGDMSRQRAETLLRYDDKEGCFVVRNSSTKGLYTLSLYTKVPHPQVKHYHIKQNSRSEFYLSEKHCCPSIPDLITYHRHNSGGLASRLKHPPSAERCAPATAGLSHDKWEIDPSELMLHEELGSGQFGVVRRGKWRGCIDVAVKMMKEGTMSEDDFIEEAKVMTKLQHQNLVQLYGVCSKHRPIYIVTEYMKHGALLNYLRRNETTFQCNLDMLLDMSIQVCKGMAYLERHNYIHRDLAARNCLVGAENVVKVADFGLARYVLDDQYTSSGGTKFPIKWAPPEVLNYTRFSSKSDVWAYGVLMWEVFTCGKMPYGRLKNTEVVERVQRGIVLEKPKNCPKEVYDLMKKCWALHPDERPSFRALKDQLVQVAQLLLVD